jgi:hypothetical protein
MAEVQRISLDEVVQHFEALEDPRSAVNRRHPLVSVVVIALMAVLAGASGPTAIARWAALNADFRGRVTCLSGTQFSLSSLSIFPGLSES